MAMDMNSLALYLRHDAKKTQLEFFFHITDSTKATLLLHQ